LIAAPFLQRQLDAALAASPRARELCSSLAGRTLRLEIVGTPWQFTLRAEPERLVFQPAASAAVAAGAAAPDVTSVAAAPAASVTPDVVIAGTPLALLQLSATEDPALIREGTVRIDGDAQLAQQFQSLTRLLRPDLEELVGRVAGRVPAHVVFDGARKALAWGQQGFRSLLQTSAEYLAHESRDLVPGAEAEQFQRGVEQLREQVDRLDARLNMVEKRS
jgi:ubiquinone biosynthesis protein UbiJ